MTTLHEVEAATRHSIVARRNFLVAVWAGRLLGHRDDALARYASDVMSADFDLPGPDDVVDKVAADLAAHGVRVSRAEVLAELTRAERSVRSEMLSTD